MSLSLKYFNPTFLWARRQRVLPTLSTALRDGVRGLSIPLDSNDRKIRRLRNCHAGRRAFILGNGPSLQVADLGRLKGEITFASNKIYLAFDQTEWRPTYYFVFDRLVAKNNAEVIQSLPLAKFFSDDVRQFLSGNKDAIWLHELLVNWRWQQQADAGDKLIGGVFSTNALVGVAAGWTVIYSQLQMAYYMGITEVILLGLDYDFNVPEKKVTTQEQGYEIALESQGERNHFHPDYRKPGEVWAVPRLDLQFRAFELAKETFERDGRRIVNASRKTKLEVFARSPLDSLLPA